MTGMIDDIRDSTGKWLKTVTVGGEKLDTRSATAWWNLRARCRAGSAAQKARPSYIGCTISEGFQDFQSFADWYTKQPGYGLDGYAIDKDILVRGNKEYSEQTCALVPVGLNSFLTLRDTERGAYPIGVSLCWSKFAAYISSNGNRRRIGRFATPEEAHAAYVVAKEAEARRWAQRLRNGEFIVDERVITALENWRVNAEA